MTSMRLTVLEQLPESFNILEDFTHTPVTGNFSYITEVKDYLLAGVPTLPPTPIIIRQFVYLYNTQPNSRLIIIFQTDNREKC